MAVAAGGPQRALTPREEVQAGVEKQATPKVGAPLLRVTHRGRRMGGRECGLHLCSLHRIYISPISSVFIAFLLICFYFPSRRREGVERDGDCGYLAEGKRTRMRVPEPTGLLPPPLRGL